MPADSERPATHEHDAASHARLPHGSLQAARILKQLPVVASRRACPAARATYVITPDGTRRSCEFARDSDLDVEEVDEQLRDGILPVPNCSWCAMFARHQLLADAPIIRDYGSLHFDGDEPKDVQICVVVAGDPSDAIAELGRASPPPTRVLVTAEAVDEHTRRVLDAAGPMPSRPTLALRIRDARACDPSALAGLQLEEVQLRLARADRPQIEAARNLADAAGARLVVRFALTPSHWFDFEEAARLAADAGASVDWRALGQGGEFALDALSRQDLFLATEAIASAWSRLGPADRPASVAEGAIDRLTNELRVLLESRLEHDDGDHRTGASMALPPLDHPWNTAEDQCQPWRVMLFGHAHLETIQNWIATTLAALVERAASPTPAWLRQLAHRIAAEHQHPEILELLRRIYGPEAQRAAVLAEDRAFVDDFDVTRFGGPWIERLGLDVGVRHRAVEQLPVVPSANATADVTVLVPSFRHEDFIEETLRSVLAQDYPEHHILVADDRSPDATLERARSVADARVTVRRNEKNLGLGNSVLAALETIDTPYVALLNSDDLFHPDRLRRCREVLEQNPHVQLVTTGIELIDEQGGSLTPDNVSLVLDGKKVFDWVHWFARVSPRDDLPPEELFGALLERNFLVTSSNLVARTDWLRKQADSLRSLKYCLDWRLFLEAALSGTLHHIHEPLVAYRLHRSNTVWFREGRRWSYYLEVNRVAAEAVQELLACNGADPEQGLQRAVDAVAKRLIGNSEVDGFALFLHSIVDPLGLERASNSVPSIQDEVAELNRLAESRGAVEASVSASTDQHFAAAADRNRLLRKLHTIRNLEERLLQSELQNLQLNHRSLRLEQEKASLYEDQRERIATAEGLREEIEQLFDDQRERIERAEELERRIQLLHEDQRKRIEHDEQLERRIRQLQDELDRRGDYAASLEQRVADLHEDQRKRIEHAAELEARLGDLYADQKQRIQRAAELEQRIRALDEDVKRRVAEAAAAETRARNRQAAHDQEVAAEREAHDVTRRRSEALEDDLTAAREALAGSEAELARTADELAARNSQVETLSNAKKELEATRSQLLHRVANLGNEIERLLGTREFRTGNFIWNKLPLGYMSRRGKKWYRRLLDAKDRAGMWFKRSSPKAHGTAVVAACWQWPIYSHTFVYQEMLSLTHMGLDVRLFHWDLGNTDQLHAAFQYLYDNRTQLQPVWENHRKDKEHFEKTRPGRLRSFLERISQLSGKSVEELEKEPIVMQGCTFARMAELAGARYLHSYFFYDQSFMAMQAAWLLDIPRGVSCYADHMMDDYPWKFVSLHIELCDVIVATSARIKSELSQLSGGAYDDKIIVKPNGVDGDRFTPRERARRTGNEPFEVLSVSRIEPKKGLTYLVEAIRALKERGHSVIAHVIGAKDEHSKGSLEYAAEFEACIKENGLEDQVILHGMMKQEQMPPIIEKCRAFVAPYVETESGDKDGIPTAMLEAMASSLPIVTTDSGSILEVVDDGVEGLVVPQRDSGAYAAALEKLIVDPELEQRMARAARARFDRDFDIKVTEKRLHERITGFLDEKARA